MLVERAGDDHAQQMHGGLRMPAPAGGFQYARGAFGQAGEVGEAHRLRRDVRMNVDRNVELDRGGEQLVVARIVEEAAFGRAVDHGAEKAELLDRAAQLDGDGVRVLHRQIGEAGKAVRMAGDRLCQVVVGLARHRHAVGAGHEVGAGAGD